MLANLPIHAGLQQEHRFQTINLPMQMQSPLQAPQTPPCCLVQLTLAPDLLSVRLARAERIRWHCPVVAFLTATVLLKMHLEV